VRWDHTLDKAGVIEDVAGDVADQTTNTFNHTINETFVALCDDVVWIVVILEAQGVCVAVGIDVATCPTSTDLEVV